MYCRNFIYWNPGDNMHVIIYDRDQKIIEGKLISYEMLLYSLNAPCCKIHLSHTGFSDPIIDGDEFQKLDFSDYKNRKLVIKN